MTDIVAGAEPASQEVVKPLKQRTQDDLLKAIDREVGDAIAGMVEERFKARGELLDAQADSKRKALAATLAYNEATKNVAAMGGLLRSMMLEGSATRTLSGRVDAVADRFEKLVGADVARSLNLGSASEGGLLVEGTVLELWLEPLRAASVVLGLRPEMIPVTGDTLKVTGFETDPSLVWTDEENAAAISSTPTTGSRLTAMRKALALIPITADFREGASPAVLRRIEDLMRSAYQVGFDLKWITGTGLANTVKGLRNHITASSASAGTSLANIFTDAKTAMTSIETSNVMTARLGVIMAPRSKWHLMLGALDADNKPFFYQEMLAGTWLGMPYRTTTNVPVNLGGGSNESYIIYQAFNQFFIGTSTALDIQWFQNASYTEAGALVSTIERDTEVLRGRQKTATLMPRTNAGYITTGVTYGA